MYIKLSNIFQTVAIANDMQKKRFADIYNYFKCIQV